MKKLFNYFLILILFSSYSSAFLVGDWDFEDNDNDYVNNLSNAVQDKSGNYINGKVNGKARLSNTTPYGLGGTSVHFPDEWKGARGDIFISHDEKMLLDSGKISFWFRVEHFEREHSIEKNNGKKGTYLKGLLSKDAQHTKDSGDLTFFLTDHDEAPHKEFADWPADIDSHNNIYLAVRLQTSTGSNDSQFSYFVSPDVPIVINKWYFVEYIFGSSDFGMKVTLSEESNNPKGTTFLKDSKFSYYGGVSDVYGYDSDAKKVSEIAGTKETMGLGGISWGDSRGGSTMFARYAGFMDALKWETYEEPVLIHYFDECEQNNGNTLKNYANDYTKGESSQTTIKGGTSIMSEDAKILRAVDLKANNDYVKLDKNIINNANIKDFSIIMWIKTLQDGTIISTDNNDISLKLEHNKLVAQVKGQTYTFKLKNYKIKDNLWHQIVLTRKVHLHNKELSAVVPDYKDSYETQAKIEMLLDNHYLGKYFTTISNLSSVADPINIDHMYLGKGFIGKIDEFTLLKNKLSRYTVSTIIDFADAGKNWDGNLRTQKPCPLKYDGIITINNISQPEGNIVNGNIQYTNYDFTVTLDPAPTTELSIPYIIDDISATYGNDYKSYDKNYNPSIGGTITIPISNQAIATQTITITYIGDNEVEKDEKFNVTLNTNLGSDENDLVGVGTIENDDSYPEVSIGDVNGKEGEAFNFVVSLDHKYPEDIIVHYQTRDGAAKSDDDYMSDTNTITIPKNTKSTTITIQTNQDNEAEPTEDFYVILDKPANSKNYEIADGEGKGLIEDINEATLSIGDYNATEGAEGEETTFTFDINLTTAVSEEVKVSYTINDGTASSKVNVKLGDRDYEKPQNGSFTISSGDLSGTVEITVYGDDIVENDEDFKITISTDSDLVTLGTSEGTGTIQNDDSSSLSINDISQKEGDIDTTPFEFILSLNTLNTEKVTVYYSLVDGTEADKAEKAKHDYIDKNGTVTIDAGELNTTITVNVIGDTLVEVDEKFHVILSNPTNSTISDGNGTGTIENDDNITIEINDVNLTEGDSGYTDFNFTVTLNNPYTEDIILEYYTQETELEYNATESVDYETLEKDNKNRITFKAGKTDPQTITVQVIGDEDIENNETFNVILKPITVLPVGSAIDLEGLGTIINDDFGYNINTVTFNIERTNSKDFDINSDDRNAWYTQVSGRTFAADVVCYNKEMTEEYVLENVVAKIDLIKKEDNKTIDTRYAYFKNESRAHATTINIHDASKDVRFSVSLPTKTGYIYKYTEECANISAEMCYTLVTNKPDVNGTEVQPAQDNFAIRPAGFSYGIKGDDDNIIIENSNNSKKPLAAEHEYKFIAKALNYDGEDTNLTGYDDTSVVRTMLFTSNTSCDDTNNIVDTTNFKKGNLDDTLDINQTAKYTLSLEDTEWTKVDQNGKDCIGDSSIIDTTENSLQGCKIDSQTKVNGIDYKDQTITINPHHFKVDITESSDPVNLEIIYMNTITKDVTTMSKQLDVNITAQGENNTTLTNFTDTCMAARIELEFNITSTPELADINDSNEEHRNLLLTLDGKTLKTIDSNITTGFKVNKDKFIKDDKEKSISNNGIAAAQINYNIDRNITATVNPVVVNFNTIKVASPSKKYNLVKATEVVPRGVNNSPVLAEFVYARVRSTKPTIYAETGGVARRSTLALDVYCNHILDTDPNCINPDDNTPIYGAETLLSGEGWWLATANRITNAVGSVTLIKDGEGISLKNNKKVIIPNNPNEDDSSAPINALNTQVNVQCDAGFSSTQTVSIDIDNSNDWLVYRNPLYLVECSIISDWAGKGEEKSVLGGATFMRAAAVEGEDPVPVQGGAGTLNPTNRLSW